MNKTQFLTLRSFIIGYNLKRNNNDDFFLYTLGRVCTCKTSPDL